MKKKALNNVTKKEAILTLGKYLELLKEVSVHLVVEHDLSKTQAPQEIVFRAMNLMDRMKERAGSK